MTDVGCTTRMYRGGFRPETCDYRAKGEARIVDKWYPKCGIHLRKYRVTRPLQAESDPPSTTTER